MAQPNWLKKYLRMKPEVNQILTDLEEYHDYCRFELLNFDPKDLYKSEAWRRSQKAKPFSKEKHIKR